MWNWMKPQHRTLQSDGATRSEIVELVPFDVTIGLKDDDGVDVFALTDIVEDWLATTFDANKLGQEFARFTTVILDYQDVRRDLQASTATTFVASYQGVTVWTRQGDLLVPDETVVAAIQTQAFIEKDGLLEALQAAETSTGLGDAVTNVRASITTSGANSGNTSSSSSPIGLDIIIIVAIVIAGLAFMLLGFALIMAWRHSRQAAQKGQVLNSPEGTGDESDFGETSAANSKRASAAAKAATLPPAEVEASASGLYPESVISEDISTSLTAYYQSGMGNKRMGGGNILNDAASVSSMESYGYSLDGYTNSIAPTDAKDEPY